MRDRLPLYPGRVQLTPVSGQPNVYDMVRADQPTQEGDPLNKATFLQDAVAALFGKDGNAVPNDIFQVLSRFQSGLGNEYLWGKSYKVYEELQIDITESSLYNESTNDPIEINYSDSVQVLYDGTVTFVNPTSVTITPGTQAAITALNGLVGKYAYSPRVAGDSSYAQKYGKNFGIVKIQDGTTWSGGNYYATASKPFILIISDSGTETVVGYVNSPDPSAYPPSVSDGYTYTPLGQLGSKVQIETGSYVGTGTYGSSNPNSLTFGSRPKTVILSVYASGIMVGMTMINGQTTATPYGYSNSLQSSFWNTITWTSNGVSWYNSSSAENQLNVSNLRVYYIAIL